MVWIKFSDKKPLEDVRLITRCVPWDKKGDAFEDWRVWKNDYLRTIPSITHWWNDIFDLDLAVRKWKENHGTSSTGWTTESRTA